MYPWITPACCLALLGWALASAPDATRIGVEAVQEKKQPDLAALEKQRCPKPAELAIVFSLGYGGDLLPRDDARFGELLAVLKAGGFNTVHCTHSDKRLELCKLHGIKMMVDLLAEQHHVYKSPEKAQAICARLRDDPNVWGYNIWNDPFGKSGEGRRKNIND